MMTNLLSRGLRNGNGHRPRDRALGAGDARVEGNAETQVQLQNGTRTGEDSDQSFANGTFIDPD